MSCYQKGDKGIAVERIEGFGKNPGLWLVDGNVYTKVASFGSEEKAELFQKMLEYFFGSLLVRREK